MKSSHTSLAQAHSDIDLFGGVRKRVLRWVGYNPVCSCTCFMTPTHPTCSDINLLGGVRKPIRTR